MRKILTFVAALCCTMFLSVQTAKAGALPDGVEILVEGTDASVNPSDILGDGTVSYDIASHTLTLDAATIYGSIYIDGSALSDVVSIEVRSNCLVRSNDEHAIQYYGFYGLQIFGNDDSNILSADVLGMTNDYCAILCASDPTGTDATPLTVSRIRLNASNSQLSAPKYSPIVCDRYDFDKCMLSISTSAAREPITTFTPSLNLLENVELMDQSAFGETNLMGLHYDNAFPVWVDGVQMHDGLGQNMDGFYILSSGYGERERLSSIKEGSIGYDPATNTIWLYNAFELESRNPAADYALVVGDGTTEAFFIKAAGLWYDTHKIQGLENGSTKRGGLYVRDNLTIDINGRDVEITSDKATAIAMDGYDLTITNNGDDGHQLLIQSDEGKGLEGPGELTIEHANVEFDAKLELCSGLGGFAMNGVKFDDPAYDRAADGSAIVDAGTTDIVTDKVVDIVMAAWKLTVDISPKAAAGSVEVKNASEEVLTLPYEYSADEYVTLKLTENAGWLFSMWENGSVANPRTEALSAGTNTSLTAYFLRNINSDETFYAIDEMGGIYTIDEKLRGTPTDLSLPLPIGSGNNFRRAVFANNQIFFTEENGLNLALSVASFDGSTMGTATELQAMQERYNPIYDMVYSPAESKFYAIVHDNIATADVLVGIGTDGTITPIEQLAPELQTYVKAMAINAAGDLYVLTEDMGAQLYTMNKTTAEATHVGTIPGIIGLPTYYQTNLFFDRSTDELILATSMPTQFYLVNPATADADLIGDVIIGINTLFQLSGAPKPKHTITVEVASGHESMGDVNINGGSKSGEFEEGASITLNAIANSGYAFDKWNDDNTDEVRTIKVGTADATYTASFKLDDTPKHTITVAVEAGQESMGDVDINGGGKSGEFAEGKKITLNAKPNSGYKFVKWNDENTDKSRSFTVGTKDETFIASFEEIPVTQNYPVTVAGVTLNEEQASLIAGTDLSGILKAGFISYDPATNTLTLNNVELELNDASLDAFVIDGEGKVKSLNIVLVGTCKITVKNAALRIADIAAVTISGDGSLTIKGADGILLDGSDLTLDGMTLAIDATNNGIGGTNAEVLTVRGASISVKGALGSIAGLDDMVLNYCSFKSGYKFENNQVEKGGSLATDAVILDIWPKLTVSPVDKGSATFTLKSKNTGETFTDKGWFEEDDEVTISPEEADNFVFARWMDDADWKDKDLRIKETRKITKKNTDETFSALFYFEPESSNDWFGVNNDEFIKFSLDDHAAKVARANNSLSDVKGGDYDGENWIFIEDATVNYFEFDGTLKDGEDILGKSGKIEKYCKKSITDATDMTIDFMEGDIYAVAESKLFEITKSEAKEIATFKLDGVETIIYAIAIDANGTMYALGRNSSKEALLYTVSISDKEAKLKVVGKPENGGKVGGAVVDGAQALAFDLSTGELFWGAADYLRIIDTKKMQTFVVGDLGQKGGTQGTIKSLHCLTQMVEVGVTVAEGQESWGTATIGETSTTGKKNQYVYEDYLPGETVTITATAKEGYHFDHWEIEGDKKHVPYTPATLEFEAEEIVYVAYFAEGEGIESITIDPTLNTQKVLIDGVIYIFRDGYIYTVTGQKMQ